jgi:hypothetical protein
LIQIQFEESVGGNLFVAKVPPERSEFEESINRRGFED